MGYATDIFSSEPAGCICAICHDVLKDAVSLKNCGHTFCDECVKSCRTSSNNPSCPNCRAEMTSSNPNYVVRDIIDAMEVKCPDGGDKCEWTGHLKDLELHGNTCIYKTTECSVEGCNHTCQRKDMDDHLSNNAVTLKHMELKYDRKLKEMEEKYEKKFDKCNREMLSYKNKLQACESIIRSYGGNLAAHGSRLDAVEEKVGISDGPKAVVVQGCGVSEINGIYEESGKYDSVPKYIRTTRYKGRNEKFTLFRCRLTDNSRWVIYRMITLFLHMHF